MLEILLGAGIMLFGIIVGVNISDRNKENKKDDLGL